MRKVDTILREYATKLSFDNLKWLTERFVERMGPDLSEAVDFISQNSEIDKILASARNHEEFWNSLDQISWHVEKEFARRTPDLVSHN